MSGAKLSTLWPGVVFKLRKLVIKENSPLSCNYFDFAVIRILTGKRIINISSIFRYSLTYIVTGLKYLFYIKSVIICVSSTWFAACSM